MSHAYKFFRAGGFDQVRLDTAADLLALKGLDQKLWVALSCPVKGIEFDARTLALMDGDQDGYIRPPELLAAIDWAATRLSTSEVLAQGLDGVPLSAIKADESAAKLLEAARSLTNGQGQGVITVFAASAAAAEFAARAQAAWEAAGAAAKPLADATETAHAALSAVQAKIDDYFVRCRLAGFDTQAASALNAAEETFKALGAGLLTPDSEAIAALPLARIAPQAALPLRSGAGLNPAWAERMAAFCDAALVPLLGERESLSEADWSAVQTKLADYRAWLAAKPGPDAPDADAEAVRDLERLARYVRDLLPLANNFVSFRNFYTKQGKATFQIGTLYIDGRSAELCVAVNDAGRHASLAGLSGIYLAYCDCIRNGEKMSIAAAFTNGDSDQLMVGRNGIFYDRQGRDWQATVTRIVEHPISLRQAFWSPYKRLQRMVAEQFQKLAASRAGSVDGQLAGLAARTTAATPAPAPKAPPAPFDVGKFAGIFAAVGLAVGALGTALASMLTGILGLKMWQMPLALAGLMLLVSGPAMALAAFKLRTRTLGPLLDANGWAVNARARLNIPFGASLTQLAQLPPGAERSLSDPYAESKTPWKTYLFIGAVIFIGAAWLTH